MAEVGPVRRGAALAGWRATGRGVLSSSLSTRRGFSWDRRSAQPRRAARRIRNRATTGLALLPQHRHRAYPTIRQAAQAGCGSDHHPGEPGAAAQRGRDRARARRRGGQAGHPDELFRRPARPEGDGRGHSPRAGRRRALAIAARHWSADDPAVSRSQHGYRDGATPSDRCSRISRCISR